MTLHVSYDGELFNLMEFPFSQDKEVTFLVISSRREWAALGNMSKEDAMVEFVKLLNRCCHLFSTYVTSHKIEKEEQEKKR